MSQEYPIQQVAEKIIQGEVPSNQQLDSAFERAEEALEKSKQGANLNVHGKVLADDAMKILESTKKLVDEKNLGDRLQKLAELGKEVSERVGESAQEVSSKTQNTLSSAVDTSGMKGNLYDIMNDIRRLAYYSLHSSEFRSILIDTIELLQYALDFTKEKMLETTENLKQNISQKLPEKENITEPSLNQNYPSWYMEATPSRPVQMETPKTSQSELKDIYEEKVLQFRKKFNSLADKVSKKREYREIYEKWSSMLDKFGDQLKKLGYASTKVASQIEGKMEEISEDRELKRAWNELKDLVEGFCGIGTVDKLMNQFSSLFDELQNNKNISEFMQALKSYLNRIIEDPNLRIENITITQDFRDLIDKLVNSLSEESVRSKLSDVVSTSQSMLQSVRHDEASNQLMGSLSKFGKDFAFDANNKPSPLLIQDSLIQLKNLLVPLIRQQIISLKIPQISKSNETFDFTIDSLSVHMEDIIPSQIRIRTKNFMGLDVQSLQVTATRGLIVLKIKEIKAKFTDLHFSYHRKIVPKISDTGLADVDISKGRGMFVKLVWKITESKEGLLALHLDTATCKIDNLNITVKKSNHNGWVKNSVAESVVNAIVETVLPLEDSINGIFKEVSFKHFAENANEKLHELYEKGTEAEPLKTVKEAAKSTMESAKQVAQTVSETVQSVPEKVSEITEKITEPITSSSTTPLSPEKQFQGPTGMTWYRQSELSDPIESKTKTDEILQRSFGGGVMVVGEASESSESFEEQEISPFEKEIAQGAFSQEKKESELIFEHVEPAEALSRLETHVPAPKESPPLPLKNPSINDERAFDTTTQVGFSHDESKLPYFLNPDDVLTLPKTEEKKPEGKTPM